MKFADIIKSNSWLSIEIIFLQLYPDEKNNILEYEKVYNDLMLDANEMGVGNIYVEPANDGDYDE